MNTDTSRFATGLPSVPPGLEADSRRGEPDAADLDAPRGEELAQARRLAERYRLEFVDMDTFRIDQDLFRSIPADLMLRYGFLPSRLAGTKP